MHDGPVAADYCGVLWNAVAEIFILLRDSVWNAGGNAGAPAEKLSEEGTCVG